MVSPILLKSSKECFRDDEDSGAKGPRTISLISQKNPCVLSKTTCKFGGPVSCKEKIVAKL